jgi:hypothetical protein
MNDVDGKQSWSIEDRHSIVARCLLHDAWSGNSKLTSYLTPSRVQQLDLCRTNKLAWLVGTGAGDAALVARTTSHARSLGLCPGGLHGDNGASFIGSAVGCDVLNHVTRTPVYNVWNCTDSHRTRHSAICSVGRWDEVGARVCVLRLHRSMAALPEPQSHEAFPCWRRRPSLRMVVRACRDALWLPSLQHDRALNIATALIGCR